MRGIHLVPVMLVLSAAAAQAQSARTFVSGLGNDANPCTAAAPCRTLQRAYSVTAVDGEINALDVAGYGSVIIDHAVSIQGNGWMSLTDTASQGTLGAVTVANGTTGVVTLRGLIIDGFGSLRPGIPYNGSGTLDVQDTMIRNVAVGIEFRPAGGAAVLHVADTQVLNLGVTGVSIQSDAASVTATLDRIHVDGAGLGVTVYGSSANGGNGHALVISDSSILNNTAVGVQASSDANGVPINVTIRNSILFGNALGVLSYGAKATVNLTRSTITSNDTGLSALSSGAIISFVDNNIDGNTTDGAPTATATPR